MFIKTSRAAFLRALVPGSEWYRVCPEEISKGAAKRPSYRKVDRIRSKDVVFRTVENKPSYLPLVSGASYSHDAETGSWEINSGGFILRYVPKNACAGERAA